MQKQQNALARHPTTTARKEEKEEEKEEEEEEEEASRADWARLIQPEQSAWGEERGKGGRARSGSGDGEQQNNRDCTDSHR